MTLSWEALLEVIDPGSSLMRCLVGEIAAI